MTTPSRSSERIISRLIEDELRDSFIDYSMSVIVQRALPDARDGLKPVHRRILYAMYKAGLFPDRGYKKCATVVGDVLGKYHPHGDSAVYDTLVRMVQDFSLRYPLIDGQGNFGSIDGDSAAAYRYTEARLAPIALELLADIEEDTVEFLPNFDGRLEEPRELPARLPHLLLNGTDGIAVGMATKIPPHNLTELARAADHLVCNPDATSEDLMGFVEGPDFPTHGYIWGYEGIGDAYRTGRGLIEMRSRMHVEEGSYGKDSLIVTELPYQVSKARIIEQITKVVRSGRLDSITDLRDESDRDGVRLVIELKKGADREKVLKTLFLKTQLRTTYGVIMLALVDGKPVQLDLRGCLDCYVQHRLGVIKRRAAFRLDKSEDRAHVVAGLLRALDDLDRVIELIRSSETPEVASLRLQEELELSERQAQAILAMRLARLTGLEGTKLREEHDSLLDSIAELRQVVAEDSVRRTLLREDLAELTERYGDERRTEILDESQPFPLPVGGSGEASLILVTRKGFVKSSPVRSGAGLAGSEALTEREGDFVRQAFMCQSDDTLLVFTAAGHVYGFRAEDLPRGTKSSRGRPVSEMVGVESGDEVIALVPVNDFTGPGAILIATEKGRVKRTWLREFANARAAGIRATGLAEGDRVLGVTLTGGAEDVVLTSRRGMGIRFNETEVRAMGRSARGVKGLELSKGDSVVALATPRRDSDLALVTTGGFGKRIPVQELRTQGRAGKGVHILPERESAGDMAGMVEVHPGARIACVLKDGNVVQVDTERLLAGGRRTAGVRVRELTDIGGTVASVHPLRSGPEPVLGAAGPAGAEPESAEAPEAPEAPERQGELDLAE
ncbi:MAG: DNA gyrase subunit A [Gemmatimonadota bacterium]